MRKLNGSQFNQLLFDDSSSRCPTLEETRRTDAWRVLSIDGSIVLLVLTGSQRNACETTILFRIDVAIYQYQRQREITHRVETL